MNKRQVSKILLLATIATLVMFIFEIIFNIPVVSNGIQDWVQSVNGIYIFGAIWLITYLQVAIIPIPGIIITTATMGAGIIDTSLGLAIFGQWYTWLYVIVSITACLAGALTAYAMGRKWGRKAVTWCAGSSEEYDKWSAFLSKKGKIPYFATVLLPVFPDDILCLVAGSVRFDFWWFFWSNVIGRTIGLIATLFSLTVLGAGGGTPVAAIAWAAALVAEVIGLVILELLIKRDKKRALKNGEEPTVDDEE